MVWSKVEKSLGGGGGVGVDIWLHCGEQKHLLDVIRVRQQHRESVDSHAPSSSRRETVLKSLDKGIVATLSFIISISCSNSLLLEALLLHLWIIQLCVCIDNLVLVGEEFEALCEALFSTMPLGEWAH